jgi:hypothetical protein
MVRRPFRRRLVHAADGRADRARSGCHEPARQTRFRGVQALMLNFNFTPNRSNGFGFSGGMSAGFLYSSRQKTKMNSDKEKIRNDFDLKPWKLSYVGELLLGPVKLYGSYALDNMWDKGLDHTPYNVGFRLSNW